MKKKNESTSLKNYGRNKKIYEFKFIKRHYKKLKEDKLNTDKESKSFINFNLSKNEFLFIGKSPIHNLLPYNKKNDESYKKNLYSYIKYKSNNTKNHSQNDIIGNNYQFNIKNENPPTKENLYFILKNKKKIYSQKKKFYVIKDIYPYQLINGKHKIDFEHPKKFKFYFDNDIGFSKEWQNNLIIASGDDDVETDDEILELAKEKCDEDLADGINDYIRNKYKVKNERLKKKLYEKNWYY